MENPKRLFIDMDGTLAEYRTFESMEQYFQNGYFATLKPLQNVVNGIREFIKNNPNVEIFILSACPKDSNAPSEKNAWLERFLPEIPMQNRIYTIIGQNKRDFIPGGIGRNDFLLDDYPHNLHDWCKEGSGIKLFNGLNANSEKWTGSCISYKNDHHHISKALTDVIINGKLIIDKMDEIQIKNETRGQSMFINRDELSMLVEEHFKDDYTDVDDFRRNYTPSDWDFVKRISSSARIETHTNAKQYAFEYDTVKRKISNIITVMIESLNNQRKERVENEVKLRLLREKTKTLHDKKEIDALRSEASGIYHSTKEEFDVWNDYFKKTIMDMQKITKEFFARYKEASKYEDFKSVAFAENKQYILSEIANAETVCNEIYIEDKEKIKDMQNLINGMSHESKSISDQLLDADVLL